MDVEQFWYVLGAVVIALSNIEYVAGYDHYLCFFSVDTEKNRKKLFWTSVVSLTHSQVFILIVLMGRRGVPITL